MRDTLRKNQLIEGMNLWDKLTLVESAYVLAKIGSAEGSIW
jgi:hypothetical protein